MLDDNLYKYTDDPAFIKKSVPTVMRQRSLKVVYQLIVDHVAHQVVGYEALSRPFVGSQVIRPDLWFRAAYDCKCSVEADLLALACIVENAAFLPKDNVSQSIFVNVMPSSLGNPAFLKELERMIEQGECQPKQMVFEIVEYIDYDLRQLAEVMHTLRSFGIGIALDDVGAQDGFSVEAISQLKPDFVKIDQSLILGIAKCTFKQNWLKNMVQQLAPDCYSVIAEGIENIEDLQTVEETGIVYSQGYYWGRPMPSTSLLDSSNDVDLQHSTCRA